MPSSSGDSSRSRSGKKKDSLPPGVRGPGGPQPTTGGGRSPLYGRPGASPRRVRFEEASYPLLRRLHSWPRWLIVVIPAVLLLVGLVLTGPLAWVGGIALLIVWAFIAWLTALSWPALTQGSRLFRLLVVLALLGVVVLKFLGRF